MEDLDAPLFGLIAAHLSARDCCSLACVAIAWRNQVDSSLRWRDLCVETFGVGAHAPVGPGACPSDVGGACPTFKAAFAAWTRRFAEYAEGDARNQHVAARAWECWRKLEQWTAEHLPGVRESLRRGATRRQIEHVEQQLGFTFPPAFRMLYSIHNGQSWLEDPSHQTHPANFQGLLGSYQFYEHMVSVSLLSLENMLEVNRWARSDEGSGLLLAPEHQIVFAADMKMQKVFFLHGRCGGVGVGVSRARDGAAVWMDCCAGGATLVAPAPLHGPADGVLRWLEAYAGKLVAGELQARPLDEQAPGLTRAISLFPCHGRAFSVTVTRGVRVEASALFIPELSSTQGGRTRSNNWFFAYSIRFSMLSLAEQVAAAPQQPPLTSAQLISRHWVITDGRGHVDEVRGEAVVGLYPVVTPGCDGVVYQSCTKLQHAPGSMQGDFAFVQGSRANPTGPHFDVICEPFVFELPAFIY